MKKNLSIIMLVIMLPLISSCATITTGRHQKIPIRSHPDGATAACGNQTTITPGELTLLRGEGPYTVKIKKDGYWEETVILKKTLCGSTAGNVLIGGIIGVGVDAATGAIYKLVPEEIDVTLKPLPEPPPVVTEKVVEEKTVEETKPKADQEQPK